MKKIQIPEQPMMRKARRFAKQLYNAYNLEEKRGRDCGDLLLHWIKDCYWGLRVTDCLPIFEELWQKLHDGKHTKRNKFVYGDIDVAVWVEYPKDEHRKVIISENYSVFADDNTHIFIRDKYKDINTLSRFRVATVWKRQNSKGGYKTAKGWHFWGDDRDIKIPSLDTYRKRDFIFGYFDCRDKGHSILYSDYNKSVENAHWGESKIEYALTILREHLRALKDETTN